MQVFHFQDLEFRHTFAMCRSRHSGGQSLKWVPYGMPRLRPQLLRSSFYLFQQNPKTGAIDGPYGSGVVVSRPAADPALPPHLYAVTAYHVAVSGGCSIIRLNTKAGDPVKFGHRFLEFNPEDWHFIPGGHDIAAVDVSDQLRPDQGDWIRAARDVDFVTRDFIRRVKLGRGDDGFMLGLFLPNPGTEYNMPATRFGNIAQLADDIHPVEQGHHIRQPSHVFDIHSRPGYSGSPVFVYRTPANALTSIEPGGDWTLDTENNLFLALLGIHSGQFRESIKARKAEAAEVIRDGDDLDVPSSMTIVVPAWAILELLDSQHFKEQRQMRERRKAKDRKPKVEPESAAPASDENPNHREDFTSLLNAAVRKTGPEGQT